MTTVPLGDSPPTARGTVRRTVPRKPFSSTQVLEGDGMNTTPRHTLLQLSLFLILVVAILSCKTAPQTATLDTSKITTLIQVQSTGLSPNNDGFDDSIEFQLYTERRQDLKSWMVAIAHTVIGTQKVFSGKADLPEFLSWDGMARTGRAPEGLYTATMRLDYVNGSRSVTAKSAPFRLDVTPPAVRVSLSPVPFSPDGDGVDDEITISLQTEDPSGIESWIIDILDPMEHLFARFSGMGSPAQSLVWNGRSAEGELVQSADDYPLIASVRDTLGNNAEAKKEVPVDVLVFRDGDRLKIVIASITFPPYSADFTKISADQSEENEWILKRLAEILKKFARYKITIEGHAVMVYWYDPARGEEEHRDVLLPLSKARAEAVKRALTGLGIEQIRMSTVGLGGSQPIVPFSDLENRWKNRRVEFILEKQ